MMQILSTILLAPILLVQGVYVRATVQKLPEPEGRRRGVIGSGPVLRLLIIGDSSAAGVGAPSQESALLGTVLNGLKDKYEVRYALLAETGDNTMDCLRRINAMKSKKFDWALTALGVNDVTSGCFEKQFVSRQAALIALLKSKFKVQHITLSGLPPVSSFPALPQPLRWYLGAQAKRFDRRLQQLAKEHQLDYIEFEYRGDSNMMASDGFHPGPPMYEIWGAKMADLVRNRWTGGS